MQPGRLRAVLESMVADGSGALVLPSVVGDGLAADVRDRLNTVARQLTTDGQLAIDRAVVTQTATGATVNGRSALLGLEGLAVQLTVGPGDGADLTVALASGRGARAAREFGVDGSCSGPAR